MSGYRDQRIGITNAARLMDVRVSELKTAIQENTLLRGVEPPQPIFRGGSRGTDMYFQAGQVMDCAERIKTQAAKSVSL